MMGTSVESGQTRLYVRMEGLCPFALFVDEDMHRDAQEELVRHYARDRYGPKADMDLVLVRCVLFTGNDQLMDFARVKRKQEKRLQPTLNTETMSPISSKESHVLQMKNNSTFINVLPVYHSSGSPEAIRESYRSKTTPLLGNNNVVSGEANDAAALMPSTTYLSFVEFHRLVLMMTDPRNSQRELFTRIFLLTYRQFVSPKELLDRILERYEVPLLTKSGEGDRSPLEHQIFLELRRDIQFAVFGVLEFWVKNYYYDFADDTLYYYLERWVKDKINSHGAPATLLQLMKDNDRTALHARVPHVLPGVINEDKTPTKILIQYSSHEIAAQITILTSHVHNHLTGSELIGQRWRTEEAGLIPNFIQYRDFFSQVNNWVSYAIVSEGDFNRRLLNLVAIIFVCDELYRMRNWDMLVAVYGGLRVPAVERLHHTWKALPPNVVEVSTKLQKLLNPDAGYKTLKNVMREGKRSQFPCIAVFIEDLIELEDDKNSQEGLLNFGRCLQQYQLLQYFLLGRNVRVGHLVRNDDLMGSFSFWQPVDSSVLMDLSNRIEGA